MIQLTCLGGCTREKVVSIESTLDERQERSDGTIVANCSNSHFALHELRYHRSEKEFHPSNMRRERAQILGPKQYYGVLLFRREGISLIGMKTTGFRLQAFYQTARTVVQGIEYVADSSMALP